MSRLDSNADSSSWRQQEEEEGSDEEAPRQQPLWLRSPRSTCLDELLHLQSSDTNETPPVSPLEEAKGLQPQQSVAVATLHEASR